MSITNLKILLYNQSMNLNQVKKDNINSNFVRQSNDQVHNLHPWRKQTGLWDRLWYLLLVIIIIVVVIIIIIIALHCRYTPQLNFSAIPFGPDTDWNHWFGTVTKVIMMQIVSFS